MSLNLSLTNAIDEIIQEFIIKVSTNYNLDKDEIKKLWNGTNNIKNLSTEKSSLQVTQPIKTIGDKTELYKCNKTELVVMCKTFGHKCSGTKEALISRLLGKNEEKSEPQKAIKVSIVKETPIIKKLKANIPNINVKRNCHNNYEHSETGLIFDNTLDIMTVIGSQRSDGSIEELTTDDIDKCNKYKFNYKLPTNLDSKLKLVDVIVKELEDDEDEDDDDLEIDDDDLEIDDEDELLDEDEDE